MALLKRDGMAALTPHTNVDVKSLRKELDAASRRGFALTYEENEIGVGAVAAPIMAPRLSGDTECVGVVSVAAPTNRMTARDDRGLRPARHGRASRLAHMWPLDERASLSLQRPA